ncbi:MAG: hypothetical protein JW863_04980 [Chitinispirillaceae bacterium]|nr:hypothetical protein [Chitinispirillaceae bacterium]
MWSLIPLLLLTVCAVTAGGTIDTVHVDPIRESRKIQLDGFLMEWSPATAAQWGSDTSWRYDVMATPEGIAGYLRVRLTQGCARVRLCFSPDSGDSAAITLPVDSAASATYFRVDRSMIGEDSTCTVEWLFPWPAGHNPVMTPFSLSVAGTCGEKGMLPVLHFTCRYQKKKSGRTFGLIGRILLIGVLGALYLIVQAKIRNQSRRKESPRQSA